MIEPTDDRLERTAMKRHCDWHRFAIKEMESRFSPSWDKDDLEQAIRVVASITAHVYTDCDETRLIEWLLEEEWISE